ncbi:uncharacterized protein LOC121863447 [Homarus americanus]|uniref:uncharacterized protein LOC121863447 n=1 Tax=Homarus americanus TaxID=6706 RepID=UPI001C480F49|nr:uncharacterized protein LOC121863447 [Homarus americanus]
MRPGAVLWFTFLLAVHHLRGVAAWRLNYLACYNEDYLDYAHLEIFFLDLEERSATECARHCLQQRPSTQLVMAKMIQQNERLVCGCGDEAALGNKTGSVDDFFRCQICPEGHQKCGGTGTTSIYQLDYNNHTTPTTTEAPTTTTDSTTISTTTPSEDPVVVYVGCYREEGINTTFITPLYLRRWDGDALQCFRNCTNEYPHLDYYFLTLVNENEYCACGSEEALRTLKKEGAQEQCRQVGGEGQHLYFGGLHSYAVYKSSSWAVHVTPSSLLLLCLLRPLLTM